MRRSDDDRRYRRKWIPCRTQHLLASSMLRLLCVQGVACGPNLFPSRGTTLLWPSSCGNFEASLLGVWWGERLIYVQQCVTDKNDINLRLMRIFSGQPVPCLCVNRGEKSRGNFIDFPQDFPSNIDVNVGGLKLSLFLLKSFNWNSIWSLCENELKIFMRQFFLSNANCFVEWKRHLSRFCC